jgi:hypothetical protein
MGYNMHDLKNGVEQFHDRIREREEDKGRELGNHLFDATKNGRYLRVKGGGNVTIRLDGK